MTTRRVFMISSVLSATALSGVSANATLAVVPTKGDTNKSVEKENLKTLDEKNPKAVALGYKNDTKTVDVKKYVKHKNEQSCMNCALYAGKKEDKSGKCGIFVGEMVNANGWCSAYSKKA